MKHAQTNPKMKRTMIVSVLILAILAVTLISYSIINNAKQPEPSVANFCAIVSKEKNNLMSIEISNNQKFASYSEIEKVSPDEIIQTVKSLREGYKQMADNPSSSTSVNAGLTTSFNAFNSYVNKSCQNI